MKTLICLIVICLNVPCILAEEQATIDFNRDVRPILSGRCFKCHGPDQETREGGLRLDLSEAARQKLESGEFGIVDGHPEQSALVARISTDDDSIRMPPPEAGPALTQKEVDILSQWIKEGAAYSQHWSFVAPKKLPLPKVSDPAWCRNEIDYYVLNRLDAEGLKPSQEADRATLIRRLSIDLTGLPPAPEEIHDFVSDDAHDAYGQLVERLLASPSFGERWGRIWLDMARYADSAGYADDPPRVIWSYRDWVIRAINEGIPFDQFTVEQLAGDLLPEPTTDQLIATAFHRNTMTNSEGGTDDEEFRTAAIVDRVNTSMQVWMGLTMGCAQCHTHKYDPITQEEYFRVYAIFNQTEDADRRDESPLVNVMTEELKIRQDEFKLKIEAAKQDVLELEKQAQAAGTLNELPTGEISAQYVRIELPGKDKILSLAEVQLLKGEENVALKGKATQSSLGSGGTPERAIDGNTDGHYFNAQSTSHTETESNPWWEVDLGAVQRVDQIVIWNRNDSPDIGSRLNGVRVILLDAQRNPTWAATIEKTTSLDNSRNVPLTAADVSEDERKTFQAYVATRNPELLKKKEQLAALEKQFADIKPVTTPVMKELPADKHRRTHIQMRGNFLDLGPEVTAGFPQSFNPPQTTHADRMELAKWFLAEDNPLTARVIANRHWEALFGMGIVETSEDFGLQGELPSHKELLDQLAISIMDMGWDVKRFIREIVMSSTYRQDSSVTDALFERDSDNRLLARGPRFRLSAEMIRDQALSIAGLLSDKMEGPSVQPPRPKLGLSAAFGGSTDWETSKGEDKYRRGVYTEWRRSIPYPSMDTFDAPSREVCTLRIIRTNTPLQALVTLNDPVYVEAAQGLAGRILNEGGEQTSARIAYGFLLCTARQPNSQEAEVLLCTFDQIKQRFATQTEEAKHLQVLGLAANMQVPTEEQAAWTVLSNIFLNLDETLTVR